MLKLRYIPVAVIIFQSSAFVVITCHNTSSTGDNFNHKKKRGVINWLDIRVSKAEAIVPYITIISTGNLFISKKKKSGWLAVNTLNVYNLDNTCFVTYTYHRLDLYSKLLLVGNKV